MYIELFEEIDIYIDECNKLFDESDPLRYSQYIHGGLLPTLEKQR